MKAVVWALVFTVTGCASHISERGSIPDGQQYTVQRGLSVATLPSQAIDQDPTEYGTQSQALQRNRIRRGCRVDFLTLTSKSGQTANWRRREFADLDQFGTRSGMGHVGTYRRFTFSERFEQNSARLEDGLKEELSWFGQEVIRSPLMPHVTVIGHTNSDGSDQYNQQLSEKRARVVANFLMIQGLPETRVHYVGVGQHVPLQSIPPELRHELHRRVELATFLPSERRPDPSNVCLPGYRTPKAFHSDIEPTQEQPL